MQLKLKSVGTKSEIPELIKIIILNMTQHDNCLISSIHSFITQTLIKCVIKFSLVAGTLPSRYLFQRLKTYHKKEKNQDMIST